MPRSWITSPHPIQRLASTAAKYQTTIVVLSTSKSRRVGTKIPNLGDVLDVQTLRRGEHVAHTLAFLVERQRPVDRL